MITCWAGAVVSSGTGGASISVPVAPGIADKDILVVVGVPTTASPPGDWTAKMGGGGQVTLWWKRTNGTGARFPSPATPTSTPPS